ncbi:uncharacterized protein BX664DRAFT_381313 [Halteromyces radiatus]|uniref:uncharacterized protein n=1 Tax=Halteromyces radiatus TaxID=101107 RepID=UPI00221E90F5|nr:uncharacterized protein BX664DRAFT_381313 [Halteromyces radiatus]KAI8098625.1 hypothetical protein BX664DRAFT_381313 [Halteromyces radiatus]
MNSPVTLLSFNINDIGDQFDQALERLPKDEHEQVLRYKFESDRRHALVGRLLRRYYYSRKLNIPWDSLKFYLQKHGKPALIHPQGKWTDFNISHDGDWVIFGATEEQDMCIGVDVVWMNQTTFGSINDFIFSFSDQLMIEEQDLLRQIENEQDRLLTFYQIWGVKESYIKAIGKGLGLDLNDFCIQQVTSRVDVGGTQKRRTTLELKTKEKKNHWCIYLGYLDSQSISTICYGSSNAKSPLDNHLVALGHTTLELGEKFDEKHPKNIFTRMDLCSLLSSLV